MRCWTSSHGGIGRVAAVTAPGLLVTAVILFMGAVSGAHLNPVLTLAFALRQDFHWRRVPGYLAAQIVGATAACVMLRVTFGAHLNFGASHPRRRVQLRAGVRRGSVVVLCVEVNVVRVQPLCPYSLLTPFTDNVQLTGGDRRAYTGQATAQRNKGFEDIDVAFDPPPSPGTGCDTSRGGRGHGGPAHTKSFPGDPGPRDGLTLRPDPSDVG